MKRQVKTRKTNHIINKVRGANQDSMSTMKTAKIIKGLIPDPATILYFLDYVLPIYSLTFPKLSVSATVLLVLIIRY